MNRFIKQIVSCIMIVSLLLCITVSAFAALADNVKQYKSMTVLGDSIPCAFGYPTCKSFAPAEGSYPDALSKLLGMDDYCSLAFCGCSLTTLLYMLGIEVNLDDVAEMRDFVIHEVGEGTWATLDSIREGRNAGVGSLSEKFASSDLILIDVGSNDLCHIPFYMAKAAYNSQLSAGKSKAEALANAAAELARYVEMGFTYFMTAYPEIIKAIRSMSPDADIVLVGAYNPFINSCLFKGFEELKSGKLVNTAVELENAQLALWAKQYGCIYADVFDVSYSFGPQCLTSDEFDNSDGLATHPSLEGHMWMAQQILKVLPSAERKLCVPCNTVGRIELGGTDIGEYSIERGFLGWTLKSNESDEYLVPGDALTVTTGNKSVIWGYDGGFFCIGKVVRNTGFGFKYLSIQKRYLTADPGGALSLCTDKVTADIYLKN